MVIFPWERGSLNMKEKGKMGQQKTLPARRSRVTHMKFLRKLLQEKAMAETMWDNKVTNITNTNQYHLVVVFNAQ